MSDDPSNDLPDISDSAFATIIGEYVLDAVIIAGPDSTIYYWNSAAETLFGYPREDVLGRNMHDIITPERYRERAKQGFARFRETGEGPVLGKVVRIEALRSTGEEFPIELSISPILLGALPCAVGILRDDTVRRNFEAEQIRKAQTDSLTGALNRRAFMESVEAEAKRAQRYNTTACLMVLDLDYFKSINDRYGHAAGDNVLIAFHNVASACIRSTDSLGRLGGEEFGILLPETELEGACQLAERLRHHVEGLSNPHEMEEIRFTVSGGIVQWVPAQESAADALKRADAALYEAKRKGRNCIECAVPFS